jgi:hypothetical protein
MSMIKQKCDFCEKHATVDGKTKVGPWAFMCEDHLKKYGYPDSTSLTKKLEQPAELEVPKKRCVVCGEMKPLTDFYDYNDHAGTPRKRNDCKVCNLAAKKRALCKGGR